jgi:hypothetical protein
MKNYHFLFKPVFFIFNLLFATWLVFKIEDISPSDFGKYKSIFDDPPGSPAHKKKCLKKICTDYKSGAIDSIALEQKLEKYINTNGKMTEK